MLDWTGENSDSQAWQSLVNMQVSGTPDVLRKAIRFIRVLPSQREWSRPMHDVTEGIMKLADDESSDATLLIGVG